MTLAERQAKSPAELRKALDVGRIFRWETNLGRTVPVSFHQRLAALDRYAAGRPANKSMTIEGDLPGWALFIREAIDQPPEHHEVHDDLPIQVKPFATLLMPLARLAFDQVLAQADPGLSMDESIRLQLIANLLDDLLDCAGLSLLAHFDAQPSWSYAQYLDHMQQGGMGEFCLSYPALTRLLGQRSLDWITGTTAFLRRIRDDAGRLADHFAGGTPLGPIRAISAPLSMAHDEYGPVRKVTFASGTSLLYKPKPDGPDRLYNAVCLWINDQLGHEELKPLDLLSGDGYAWHAVLSNPPLLDPREASAYYRRAGRLTALTQVLGSTDYHADNVMAAGAFPVLVDNETILSCILSGPVESDNRPLDPYRSMLLAPPSTESPGADAYPPGWTGDGYDLPYARIVFGPDGEPMMKNDSIRRETGNQPILAGIRQSLHGHREAFMRGHRDTLDRIKANTPSFMHVIAEASGQFTLPFRIVWRATPWYWSLRETLRKPETLQDGLDRSIALEQLAAVYANWLDDDKAVSCLQHEIEAMERLCIPSFSFAKTEGGRQNKIPNRWIRKHPGEMLRDNLDLLSGLTPGEVPAPWEPNIGQPG